MWSILGGWQPSQPVHLQLVFSYLRGWMGQKSKIVESEKVQDALRDNVSRFPPTFSGIFVFFWFTFFVLLSWSLQSTTQLSAAFFCCTDLNTCYTYKKLGWAISSCHPTCRHHHGMNMGQLSRESPATISHRAPYTLPSSSRRANKLRTWKVIGEEGEIVSLTPEEESQMSNFLFVLNLFCVLSTAYTCSFKRWCHDCSIKLIQWAQVPHPTHENSAT